MTTDQSSRICFIIPHYGAYPNYIKYFIYTAGYNAAIADFYFFTDQPFITVPSAPNVFFKSMTLNEFNDLCYAKLNVKSSVTTGYKLCDLRPMYGVLFDDYIRNYGYWGHCDYDMVLGDIQSMLKKNDYENYDIFSVQELYSSGPFQVYRNTEKVNHFFMNSPDWVNVLTTPDYLCFDECAYVCPNNIWSCTSICSMTHLIKDEALLKALDIRVSMKTLIDDRWLTNEIILFNDGKLIIQPNQEIYIFHLFGVKHWLFNYHFFPKKIKSFKIIKRGFHTGNRFLFLVTFPLIFIKKPATIRTLVMELKKKIARYLQFTPST